MKTKAVWNEPSAIFTSIDSSSASVLWKAAGKGLLALEQTYAAGLDVYLAAEKLGIRRRLRVPVPVISVGNLSVGGTGKTPAVITIGHMLQQVGLKAAVLSRGHGGSKSKDGGVVSDNRGNLLLTIEESGDEPQMLARSLPGIPVLVGKDRRKTALMAIERFSPDILLLDDGFQYWQLARDIDIVLLDADHPFDNGHCLPRGLLREPRQNLRRAHIVIVTRSSKLGTEDRTNLNNEILKLAPTVNIYYSEHVGLPIEPANTPAIRLGMPEAALALCAIGNPASFRQTVKNSGLKPVSEVNLSDHYRYSINDRSWLMEKMTSYGADSLVTTEKDYVKLEHLLPDTAIFVQPVTLELEERDVFVADLLERTGLPRSLAGAYAPLC